LTPVTLPGSIGVSIAPHAGAQRPRGARATTIFWFGLPQLPARVKPLLDTLGTLAHLIALSVRGVAPALLVAQSIGRLGNYFNQELSASRPRFPGG
jgi:hypothetical protein